MKSSLGTVSAEALAKLRRLLVDWVHEARTAGLDNEDIDALVRDVLADEPKPKGEAR